jgi:shikimate kinase
MERAKRIFIVGHSGAGKGVLAKELAKKMGWKFVDADVFGSVGHIGRTPQQVLGENGLQCFNNCMIEILEHHCTQENIVVTTDESIIGSSRAQEILKSEFTVFLQVSTAVQAERMQQCAYRPLLPVDDYSALLQLQQDKYNTDFSDVASFSLSSDDGDLDAHTQKVMTAYSDL